jgi:glutamate-1-semialdehyde 2,1-aminomutase
MKVYPQSKAILNHNRNFLTGGVASTNRLTDPEITFVKASGAHLWDADGNRYIDYHAAFAPYILGHNHPVVNEAAVRAIESGVSLYGAGTSSLEGRLAELICRAVPFADLVALLNTGSEATYQAMRLARAATGRGHFIVMQGGYNGWHNDVSCDLMTPLADLGRRVSPGEYPFLPISAGIPENHRGLIHPINFNDLESVKYVLDRYPVAGLITEPVLQNIGIVPPMEGYLAGLRQLADERGFVLIFDEVKTGFRHALGGHASISGVTPDLAVYGKAIANGYPMAAIAGKRELMELFTDPDPSRRVLLAGTYNGHPVATAAAIATIELLMADDGALYRDLEHKGRKLENGINDAIKTAGVEAFVSRIGSALCLYFMPRQPQDWHDLASHNDFAADLRLRRQLIDGGIYVFPLAAKQWSISTAHTADDIDATLEVLSEKLQSVRA